MDCFSRPDQEWHWLTIAQSDEVRDCCDWQSRGQDLSDDDYGGGDDDEEMDNLQVWKIHHDHHHDNQEYDLQPINQGTN